MKSKVSKPSIDEISDVLANVKMARKEYEEAHKRFFNGPIPPAMLFVRNVAGLHRDHRRVSYDPNVLAEDIQRILHTGKLNPGLYSREVISEAEAHLPRCVKAAEAMVRARAASQLADGQLRDACERLADSLVRYWMDRREEEFEVVVEAVRPFCNDAKTAREAARMADTPRALFSNRADFQTISSNIRNGSYDRCEGAEFQLPKIAKQLIEAVESIED